MMAEVDARVFQPVIREENPHHCDTDTEALHTALQSDALLDKRGLKGVKLFSLILVRLPTLALCALALEFLDVSHACSALLFTQDLAILVRRKCSRTKTKSSRPSKTDLL